MHKEYIVHPLNTKTHGGSYYQENSKAYFEVDDENISQD